MRKIILAVMVLCLITWAPSLFAQDTKFEISGSVGYALSEGVDFEPDETADPAITRISPKSGFAYDIGMDFFVNENFSIGFNYGQQRSKLRVRIEGEGTIDAANMDVNNYHGLFTYHFGDRDTPIRPYIFGGLGATNYSPDGIEGFAVEGLTKFSSTWGGGVKFFATEHLGFKGGVRWTPTYINSTAEGIFCSGWWYPGCWVVGNSNFSNQFEMTGGFVIRY